MNPQLHNAVYPRLMHEFSFKEEMGWLRKGVCPDCNKKELYTHAETPWVLRCGRLNNCNAEIHIKELYPDLFESWSDRYPRTESDPKAAAKAYLIDGRGLNADLVDKCYTQENYYDSKKDIGSATIRFKIADGVFWERIIDRPKRFGDRKANFHGSYSGLWWQMPGIDISAAKEIWIVEGIFDAIALNQNDICAVSIMSCNNYPDKMLAELLKLPKRPILVWALDNDNAGKNYTKKWVQRARLDGLRSEAAQIHSKVKLDWNDLHQRGRLTESDIKNYRYFGDLLLAPNANAKGLLIHSKTGHKEFHFDYQNRLYWFNLDFDKYSRVLDSLLNGGHVDEEEAKERALIESGGIITIANCLPEALYYQANSITDESWYYFRVSFPDDAAPIKNTFTGSQLSSAGEFKKRLLHIAQGAIYTGNSQHLDKFLLKQFKKIKKVQTTDFIGYSKEYQAYVYADIAIRDGKLYKLNDDDYFDMGKISLKTLNQSVSLSLNHDLKTYKKNWPNVLYRAFGPKGVAALAFWFGAMFAEQIRDKYKSFPFLEIVGEPGSGKTTLIEFLWKLCGRRDYEGFDPSKSTLAARARNFSQVSNMPVVLIEGDRNQDSAKQRGFDWEELKTAYNGRSVRSRGLKNAGNETYEPPFRGAIVIAQNADVSASNAVLERIIHVYTDRSAQTIDTKLAAEELERMSLDNVSGFMIKAALHEKHIMNLFDEKVIHYQKELELNPELKHVRIIKNHSQLLALVDCLRIIIGSELSDHAIAETKSLILDLALERKRAVNADHPYVQEFWDAFEFLETHGEPILNHSRDRELIAINLNHFQQIASESKQLLPPISELKNLLKTSKRYKFVDIKAINSSIHDIYNKKYINLPKKPTSVKCWVFEKNK